MTTSMQATTVDDDRIGETNAQSSDNVPIWRRWSFLLLGSVFLLLVMIVGLIAWLTSGDETTPVATVRPEETPLIRAPEGAYKVAPDTPGGMEVPYRDKYVYERLERIAKAPGVERLLPPPEQPLTPPRPLIETATPSVEDATPDDLPQLETRVIPTRPDSALAEPAPVTESEPQAVLVTPFRLPRSKPNPPAIASATPPPSTPAPAFSESFQIQLIAVSSQAQATGVWEQLKRQHAAILGGLSPAISRVELNNGRTVYRLRAGAFQSAQDARKACADLKSRGVDCVMVRPRG